MSEREPEEILWQKYKESGDPHARESLITQYAPLVKYVVGRLAIHLPPDVDFEDLVGYGVLGLIDAVEKFNPERGVKFKTYAMLRVRGAIIDELRLIDWVPRQVRQKARILEETYSRLEASLGRVAEDYEVADALNLSVDDFNDLVAEVSGTTLLSLNDVWYQEDDEEITIADTLAVLTGESPDGEAEAGELRRTMAKAIDDLPEKERLVISMYYYDGLTLKEIGKVLDVTESRVSQMHTKSILRLRARMGQARDFLKS